MGSEYDYKTTVSNTISTTYRCEIKAWHHATTNINKNAPLGRWREPLSWLLSTNPVYNEIARLIQKYWRNGRFTLAADAGRIDSRFRFCLHFIIECDQVSTSCRLQRQQQQPLSLWMEQSASFLYIDIRRKPFLDFHSIHAADAAPACSLLPYIHTRIHIYTRGWAKSISYNLFCEKHPICLPLAHVSMFAIIKLQFISRLRIPLLPPSPP